MSITSIAPILLFTFNRLRHTQLTIEALQKNNLASESILIIYSDGAGNKDDEKKVHEVRNYLKSIQGFKEVNIIERENNYGLSKNIIEGVSSVIKRYGKVIVLEDDLVTTPYFLEYMNEALTKYENTSEVISIHGYCVPIEYPEQVFFLKGADCWGWGTWKRGWQLFEPDSKKLMEQLKQKRLLYEFDLEGCYNYSGMLQKQIEGKINSWAIRWYASAFLHNKLTLHPGRSLVKNIGADGSGTHLQNEKQYGTNLADKKIILPDIPIEESKSARMLVSRHFYKYLGLKGKLKKILNQRYK